MPKEATLEQTLHDELLKQGYRVVKKIPYGDPIELQEASIWLQRKYSDKVFTNYRIVPVELALKGKDYTPTDKVHLLYAQENPEHPKNREAHVWMVSINIQYSERGDILQTKL